MKTWNAPEVAVLDLVFTAGNNKGNTGDTGVENPNYKSKNQHCECGHSTNFDFQSWCTGNHGTPTDSDS